MALSFQLRLSSYIFNKLKFQDRAECGNLSMQFAKFFFQKKGELIAMLKQEMAKPKEDKNSKECLKIQ